MMKKITPLLLMILWMLPILSNASAPTPIELQLTYLSLELARSEFKDRVDLDSYYENTDERFKNTVKQIAEKYDPIRNIVPLTKEEFTQLATYSFDRSVNVVVPTKLLSMENDPKTKPNAYYKTNGNINFTDGKTFVKSERNGQYIEMSLSGNLHGHGLSNSSEMRVSSDNIYLINVNNRLHLAETEKRMEEFRGIDIYSNLVKMSPQLGEIKPNEPFVSVYDENANMQNARILKKPKTTLKRIEEGTARVYSTANEVEILGPKKNKYGSSDVYEKKQLKDFFNDETVAENYIGPLSAAPPGGGPINLDGIKGMIENITSTTKNILDGIAKIPSYLAKIYDFVATMFDVSEFQLDLTPLKIRLIDRFPFCIPSDFLNGIKLFNASVSEPKFNVKLETQYLTVNETIDGSILHYVRGFFRYVAVAWYSIFLIMRTRSMIKW